MFSLLLQPIRLLVRAFTDQDSPKQIAMGLALGAVIGLVPKGNLLAAVLMMIVCGSRVNLGAATLSAFVFSWVGMLTDPLTHRIGLALLSHDTLTPMWTSFYNAPIIPWTKFNNTVVLGSFVFGVVLLYPLYRALLPMVVRLQPKLQERLRKWWLAKLLFGADYAGRLSGA